MSSTSNALVAPAPPATDERERLTRDALAAFRTPLNGAGAPGRERVFKLLADRWRQETGLHSSPARRAEHWAYRLIIQLGPAAVPFILREMQATPDLWFSALREITGENPAAPADRGHVASMTADWLDWGRGRL